MTPDSWRFEVEAMVDPQSLLRVLGYFAQRSVVPDALEMRVGNARMTIRLIVNDLPEAQAMIIAAKLEQIVLVEFVRLDPLELSARQQAAA
jgi:acetolactate synthase regulatory subunit